MNRSGVENASSQLLPSDDNGETLHATAASANAPVAAMPPPVTTASHQPSTPTDFSPSHHARQSTTSISLWPSEHNIQNDSTSGVWNDHHILDEKVRSSNVTAFVTLLKALFGVSLLSSPRVLGETGLILGTIVYLLIILACMGSCWCLLQARAKVASESEDKQEDNTADVRLQRQRIIMERQESNASSSKDKVVKAITYGEVGRKLFGPKQGVMINFLIVSLHVCFGAGLMATSMQQVAIVLGWTTEENERSDNDYDNYNYNSGYESQDDESDWMKGRVILACTFFPFVALLLQFRNIKDLFWVCLAGLVIFVVGCVGTMFYSATLVDSDGDGSAVWDVPDDVFEWKWTGIPNFVASTLCAMEGINLALPIANTFLASSAFVVDASQQTIAATNSPVPVVSASVGFFGVTTLLVAYFGYLSGVGGGEGTRHDSGDDDGDLECLSVAYCLDSQLLKNIHRISLACALVLTLPIILYPSLELLECWADERHQQLKTGRTTSGRSLGDSFNGFVWGAPSESYRQYLQTEESLFGTEPFFPFVHRHWRFRLGHAAAVCLLAIVERQWERALVLFKGIGLSTACFVLPVIMFVRANSFTVVVQQPMLASALAGLMTLGLVNVVLVILSVFTDHNFLPTEIHDHPPHHHEQDHSQDG